MALYRFLILIVFTLLIESLYAFDPLSLEKAQIEQLTQDYQDKLYDINKLQEIKYLIINGNTFRAKKEIADYTPPSQLLPIIHYYLSLIYFIERNYQQSFNMIDKNLISNLKGFNHICLLQLLNEIYLHRTEKLEKSFELCSATNFRYSPTEYLWPSVMVKMILQDNYLFKKNHLNKLFVNLDDLNEDLWVLWFKTAIYYNREESFTSLLENLPSQLFLSEKIRELVGFIYYRLGNYDLAKDFFNDVSTVNAENIMGNLYLQEKKWELALGHLSIAFKLKNNSINAVNRLVPLLWKLSRYEEGLDMTKRLPADATNIASKLALLAAFEFKNGHYQKVITYTQKLQRIYPDSPPKKILQLATLSYFLEKDNRNFQSFAANSCLKKDALGCLLYSLSFHWPELPEMIKKGAEIDIEEEELNLSQLIKEQREQPLEEVPYIKQVDIEELDDKLYEMGLENQF